MPADDPRRGVALIGSTGSIGTQTLDVLDRLRDRFRLVTIAAGTNVELLADQIDRFQPALAVHDPTVSPPRHRPGTRYGSGESALVDVATHPDVHLVVIASSGHASLRPTCAAIEAGKAIALANKEIVVCAGHLIMPLARRCGVTIRPIDSEHSAVWQAIGDYPSSSIARIVLTASGGPFRQTPIAELAQMTAADALRHPTWSMGDKITIDSATMANKGLELIEARWLFDVEPDRIDAMIHPQSIVHSLVEFIDGSQIAQLSWPDMRLPIQLALTYPERIEAPHRTLRLEDVGTLAFEPLDPERFPAFALAREALRLGGAYPTVYSVADEAAVAAFLAGRIGFTDIARVIESALSAHQSRPVTSIDDAIAVVHVETARAASTVDAIAARRAR